MRYPRSKPICYGYPRSKPICFPSPRNPRQSMPPLHRLLSPTSRQRFSRPPPLPLAPLAAEPHDAELDGLARPLNARLPYAERIPRTCGCLQCHAGAQCRIECERWLSAHGKPPSTTVPAQPYPCDLPTSSCMMVIGSVLVSRSVDAMLVFFGSLAIVDRRAAFPADGSFFSIC